MTWGRMIISCAAFAILFSIIQADDEPTNQELGKWESFSNLTDKHVPMLNLIHYGQKSYYIGDVFKGNFFHAEQFCRYHGMNLVTINSKEENDFLQQKIIERGDPQNHFWTSGTKLPDSSEWIWFTTGRHIAYFNWNPGEPNNGKNNEDCIEIRQVNKEFKWNDIDCGRDFNFICEITWTKDCYKLLQSMQAQNNISSLIDIRILPEEE